MPPGGDFTLRSASGPVSLRDFRGKAVLLFFGYTHCPDVCPNALAYLAQVLNGLSGEEQRRVQGIFISIDPERDTPEALAEYVAYFHPGLIGVTGTGEEVATVAGLYGAQYCRVEPADPSMGYSISHSAVAYLVSPDGELRFIFPHATPPGVLLEAVQYLLNGK